MSVDALCVLTGTAPVTIRRDLAELADHGLVRRVRGGATRAEARGTLMPFAMRFEADRERKDALASAAAALVADAESVILDNGTTCYAVARRLAGRQVTVLALSLHSAAALATDPGATVIVPGGPVENDTLAFTSHAAVEAIDQTNADVVIIGACSAMPGYGLTSTTYEDAQVKRACLRAGARAVLVATADKLERASTFRFGEPRDLAHLVTTADASPESLLPFREEGVEIHLVEAPRTEVGPRSDPPSIP